MSPDEYHILRAAPENDVNSPDSRPLPEDTEKSNGLNRSQTMPTPDAQKSDFRIRQRRASQSDSLLTSSGNNPSDLGLAEKPRQWPEEVEKSSDLITTRSLDDDRPFSPRQTENASGNKINRSTTSKNRRHKLERHYKIERVVSFIVTVLTTTGSWAYLILAILKEDQLDRHGSTAQTLYAIAAKSIEICFSVTFLTAVNLHFFHRAADQSRGITFATIHTRKWVSSPSSVLFSLPLLKEVGLTFITLSTLLAMLGVLLYTTAAQTLVFPSLSKDNHQNMELSHHIALPYMGILMEPVLEASYAQRNISEVAAETHMAQVSVALVGLTNIAVTSWIDDAGDWVNTKTEARPVPQVPMDETARVSMTAAWINGTESLLRWDRLVDNATLVFPHKEVAGYMASDDCDVTHYTEQVEVTVDAVSPMVNTLCAKMSDSDVDVWNDLYRAANQSTFSDNKTSTTDFKELLSSDKYKPLRDIAEIFGWEQLTDVPGTMLTNLTHNKTDLVVFHSINANSSASAAYFQFPYYAALHDQNVVCRIQGDLADGCSSQYSLDVGTQQLTVDCKEGGKALIPRHDDTYASKFSEVTTPLIMRTLQMETPGIMPNTSKVGLDLMLDPLVPYPKFGNQILPPRASSTVAETLSVLTGFAGAYGMLGSPMTKAGASKLRPDHLSTNERFSAAVKYTTYRNGGSAHGWQYIFYIPLVIVCLESTVIFLYACRSLFASGKTRQILDFSDPHYFFQLGLATSLYKRPTPENIEKDFAGRWTILDDAHNLQYVQSLADQPQEASAHHQAERAEPRDVEGGHGNSIPTPAILTSIVGWFKGRF